MVKLAGHVFKQQSLTFHMLKVHQNQSAGFAGHFATTNTSMSKVRQLNCCCIIYWVKSDGFGTVVWTGATQS